MRSRIAAFVVVIQLILLLAHWAVYRTLVSFWLVPAPATGGVRIFFAVASVSFVCASLLAFWHADFATRIFYTASAAWLGVFNYLFFCACACWVFYGAAMAIGGHVPRRPFGIAFFGLALILSLYGVINAASPRVTRVTVRLPNLPASWRGRVVALVSDTHLGHVRNLGFIRRIIRTLASLQPAAVFIAGDLFDGTKTNVEELAQAWKAWAPPLGTYYVTGNHEEFRDRSLFISAVARAGVRILNNEGIDLDGVQLVGVHFGESLNVDGFRAILRKSAADRARPSILITHTPDRREAAAAEDISLQVSGHTHRGQLSPFTWAVKRMYGAYAYGLQRVGDMQIYVSSGAGTWGPPLRVGTIAEIVLLKFELE
jgi:predicted MPP superfamily phosphohydrolase